MTQAAASTDETLLHSPSAGATIFIAILIAVQFVFTISMALMQSNGAHFIELTGAQRMRTQRIAFLALSARTESPPLNWRVEMAQTVQGLIDVGSTIVSNRDRYASSADESSASAMEQNIKTYAAAAQTIETKPHDALAWKFIEAHRSSLLSQLDRYVKQRAVELDNRNREIMLCLTLGVTCILSILGLAWAKVLRPNELMATKLIEKLDSTNNRLRSLLSSTSNGAADAQIDAALELVLGAFDMQCAYIGKCEGESIRITHAVGQHLIDVGSVIALQATYVQATLDLGDVLAVDDLENSAGARGGLPHYPGWHGYISAPLKIDGRVYGAIGFLSRQVVRYSEADRDYVRLVASLIESYLERRSHIERLDHLAFHDTLTSLPNRAKVLHDLQVAVNTGHSRQSGFAVHYVDLDGFKAVNDTFGHGCGDLALDEAAKRLRAVTRSHDVPARLGGDEFLVLQTKVTQISEAMTLARRIIAILSEPYHLDGNTIDLSASVGVAVYPEHGTDAEGLLQQADAALYRAKAAGKNRAELSQALSDIVLITARKDGSCGNLSSVDP